MHWVRLSASLYQAPNEVTQVRLVPWREQGGLPTRRLGRSQQWSLQPEPLATAR